MTAMRKIRSHKRPFTLEELKEILASIKREDDVRILLLNGEIGDLAVRVNMTDLFAAWQSLNRAQAELFYQQGLLEEHIKQLEKQQCQSET